MKPFKLRSFAFRLHRYIGLVVGLVLIVIGLTGSLLVFADEIDHLLVSRQMGQIIPQGQRISIDSALNIVKAAYTDRPELKVDSIRILPKADVPYQFLLKPLSDDVLRPAAPTIRTEVNVNPYTGKIIGNRQLDYTLRTLTVKLHYQLLAGETGKLILGIVAILLFILSITGIILWPGWRRLIAGFKVKLKAHPKRVNFDIHKVVGVIAAVFLAITGFTGFYFNFNPLVKPIIYALTFTPNLPNPVSQPIANSSALNFTQLLQKADAALPNAVTTYVVMPKKPQDALLVGKKLPQESWKYGFSRVYLDQYTGEVLRLKNGLEASLGDKIMDSFIPLHFGTFGGLPTRILYIFVGFAPLILFITGTVMYQYRYRRKFIDSNTIIERREESRT